jgi:pimeloyl-ACP methyl ester carboxylesterase
MGDPIQQASLVLGPERLPADLSRPAAPRGLVLFVHGSGSSRKSPRNRMVASHLNAAGLATLLFDLLHPAEAEDRRLVFDIRLLADRVVDVLDALAADPALGQLPTGLFGASTGAAAALVAAAERPQRVAAVVSRGGRPDLADGALDRVRAPTLLIVGGDDAGVVELNEAAAARLGSVSRLAVVPGATHLFEEPGALEAVADLAARWFARHLAGGEGCR